MAKEEVKKIKLNEVIIKETKRADGSVRIQQDFTNCPSLTEQHSAHMGDLNYLINKFKPDELAAYMAQREIYRKEILGHDFSQEPELMDAKNHVYKLRKAFNELPDDVKRNFRGPVEFYSFIDNPANAETMVRLGLLTKKKVDELTANPAPSPSSNPDDAKPK